MCSPYLRCVQSAQCVVKILRENNKKIFNDTVYISSWIKENQKGKDGKRKLMITNEELQNDLQEFQKTNDVFKIESSDFQMENIDEHYHKIENKDDLRERFGTFLNKISQANTIDGYSGQIIVVVSHAMMLKQAKAIHTVHHEVDQPKKVQYKYGTISLLKFNGALKWDYVIDGESEHIEKKGLDRYGTYGTDKFVEKDGDPDTPDVIKKKGSKYDSAMARLES